MAHAPRRGRWWQPGDDDGGTPHSTPLRFNEGPQGKTRSCQKPTAKEVEEENAVAAVCNENAEDSKNNSEESEDSSNDISIDCLYDSQEDDSHEESWYIIDYDAS